MRTPDFFAIWIRAKDVNGDVKKAVIERRLSADDVSMLNLHLIGRLWLN